jgi:hypothetical protein
MIADSAAGSAIGSHEERTIKGANIARQEATTADWHMHMLLYGLIRLLMDEMLGHPAENEQLRMLNVADAPKPANVGIPSFVDIDTMENRAARRAMKSNRKRPKHR